MTDRMLPADQVRAVDDFVDGEFSAADKYDNKTVLDDSGIYDLHTLAAAIYAAGWRDGDNAATTRASGERRRARVAALKALEAAVATPDEIRHSDG